MKIAVTSTEVYSGEWRDSTKKFKYIKTLPIIKEYYWEIEGNTLEEIIERLIIATDKQELVISSAHSRDNKDLKDRGYKYVIEVYDGWRE